MILKQPAPAKRAVKERPLGRGVQGVQALLSWLLDLHLRRNNFLLFIAAGLPLGVPWDGSAGPQHSRGLLCNGSPNHRSPGEGKVRMWGDRKVFSSWDLLQQLLAMQLILQDICCCD